MEMITIVTCKAVKQWYDQHGKALGYTLVDCDGKTLDVTNEQIKNAMKAGKINIVNLKITADNRLIKIEENSNMSIDRVNAKILAYPGITEGGRIVILSSLDGSETVFMEGEDYKKIITKINLQENTFDRYSNNPKTLTQLCSEFGIPNKRDYLLTKYNDLLNNKLLERIKLLILDGNKPYGAIIERYVDEKDRTEFYYEKDGAEILTSLNSVGYINMRIINGQLKFTELQRPEIVRLSDLSNADILEFGWGNDDVRRGRFILRKPNGDMQDTDGNRVSLIDKSNTCLHHFDVLDKSYDSREMISDADVLYMIFKYKGIVKVTSKTTSGKAKLYLNGILITDNIGSVEDNLANIENIKLKARLLQKSPFEAYKALLGYREIYEEEILSGEEVSIFDTGYTIRFEYYATQSSLNSKISGGYRANGQIRLKASLIKSNKVVKSLANREVYYRNHTKNAIIQDINVLDNGMTLKIQGLSNFALTIA